MRFLKSDYNLRRSINGTAFFQLLICFFPIGYIFRIGQKESFFFADDYLGLALFRSPESLMNLEASAGRPITNVYFFLATSVFGGNSNTSFLVVNFVVLFVALLLFIIAVGNSGGFARIGIIFSISFLSISGTFLPLVFWASNFNHVFSILVVGAILLLNSLNLEKQKARLTIWQSILYFLLIASNPLFSPLLLYGLVTLTVDLIGKISRHNWRLIVLNLNFALRIVLPLIYLSFISLPFLFQNNQYRLDPLASFVSNLQFYSQTDGLFLFIILLFFGLFFLTVFFQLSKARNFQTLSLMLSGLAILFIVLVQKSQQQTHYLIVPVLLVVPTLIQYFVGKTRQHLSKSSLVIGLVFLLLIPYNMTYSVRSYFMSSPWGSSVKQFHNEVMKLDLVGRDVCVRDGSGLEDWKSFIAQIGGENFFTRREVGAKSAIFITTDECPKGLDSRALSVLQLPDGSFTTE